MGREIWFCVRQRAGPLVKECRALRPRLSAEDDADTQTRKKVLLRVQRSAVSRTQRDRLELMLALFEFDGIHYTLTFDDLHLPERFADVRRAIRAFFSRAKRHNGGQGFDWIYVIEGLHGDHRYHVHMVLRRSDFTPEIVQHLWRYGESWDEPVLMAQGGYRRLAIYFTKERSDGIFIPVGRHPWSCALQLKRKLPPLERWKDESGFIEIPSNILWSDRGAVTNNFGAYYYGTYIYSKS